MFSSFFFLFFFRSTVFCRPLLILQFTSSDGFFSCCIKKSIKYWKHKKNLSNKLNLTTFLNCELFQNLFARRDKKNREFSETKKKFWKRFLLEACFLKIWIEKSFDFFYQKKWFKWILYERRGNARIRVGDIKIDSFFVSIIFPVFNHFFFPFFFLKEKKRNIEKKSFEACPFSRYRIVTFYRTDPLVDFELGSF